jgi:hypothetical protein
MAFSLLAPLLASDAREFGLMDGTSKSDMGIDKSVTECKVWVDPRREAGLLSEASDRGPRRARRWRCQAGLVLVPPFIRRSDMLFRGRSGATRKMKAHMHEQVVSDASESVTRP